MLVYLILTPVILMLVISFLGFWQATHPPKIISRVSPKDLGWQFEEITLKTSDSVKLSTWFVLSDDKSSNKAVILLHGYPADKGDLLDWSAFLKEKYHLLFIDFRYFGRSEGAYTTLGVNETKDVLAAIKFLKENKKIESIGLMGFSFGGSVGLLTLPHTQDVKASVADSAFANLDLMGEVYYGHLPYLQKPLMSLTKFWAKLIYNLDAKDAAPDRILANLLTPILIIASPADDVVSIKNSQRFKEVLKNNKNSQVVILDRGPHGYLSGTNYQKLIEEFFEKYL
ncbi:alpha/beta fold hydrolase [Candidatus Daviesbacteria bacterium]|nr:alpha/beta fold hydrolase [Candidatus Daviesbacteria bacterium]